VLFRHRDMAEGSVGEIDGRVGGEQVAGLGIREENVLRFRVGAEALDQAPGEGAGAAADAIPVRETVDGNRDRKGSYGQRRDAIRLVGPVPAPREGAEREREQPAPERDPGRPGGRGSLEAVAEIARVPVLEE